ncbi:MAG: hypothetical protein WC804_14730 [Sphingomonas sp.]|uniref:hypothetical protein n=1 Tax=Sphingomonas sp. TaxID=28214 RepID=UPI00356B1213
MPNYPRARRALLALCLAVLPAACGHKPDTAPAEGNAQGFVPPAPVAVKPMPGQATLTSLDAYIGHKPRDAVDGVMFFDRADVATALVAAVRDEKVRREFREGGGPARPIFARGNSVGIWACTARHCAGHNWAFFLDRDIGKGEACYHDAATMGATSHWYAGGDKPAVRPGACPSIEVLPLSGAGANSTATE